MTGSSIRRGRWETHFNSKYHLQSRAAETLLPNLRRHNVTDDTPNYIKDLIAAFSRWNDERTAGAAEGFERELLNAAAVERKRRGLNGSAA